MYKSSANNLLYLSGAPRVSTHKDSLAYGPRNHVLGVMQGFESLGWGVDSYIAGDEFSGYFANKQYQDFSKNNPLKIFGIDLARMAINHMNQYKVKKRFKYHYECIYERYGLFQALGAQFRKKSAWIIETNEVYFKEAAADRQSLKLQKMAKKHEATVYHNCDLVVTITQSLKDLLVEEFDIFKDKILVLPNAFSEKELLSQQLEKESHSFNILFVGLVTEWIGLQTLIQAMSRVDLPINLHIVGDGPYKEHLIKIANELSVIDKIQFHGFISRPEIFDYFDGADIGYSGHIPLTTERYHSPMKLYEYMGRGLPVISSDDEDSRVMLNNGAYGFIFERGDPEDLSRVLISAYSQRERWNSMGWGARKFITENHLWKHRVETLLEYLESMA